MIDMKVEGIPPNRNILHLYHNNQLLRVYNGFEYTETPTTISVDLRGECMDLITGYYHSFMIGMQLLFFSE